MDLFRILSRTLNGIGPGAQAGRRGEAGSAEVGRQGDAAGQQFVEVGGGERLVSQ
jgi:hypothetical protein